LRVVADGIDVTGADALLHVDQPRAGRMRLAQQMPHERVHPRRREEHAGIVRGHERG
jgi:hypothetical protein